MCFPCFYQDKHLVFDKDRIFCFSSSAHGCNSLVEMDLTASEAHLVSRIVSTPRGMKKMLSSDIA